MHVRSGSRFWQGVWNDTVQSTPRCGSRMAGRRVVQHVQEQAACSCATNRQMPATDTGTDGNSAGDGQTTDGSSAALRCACNETGRNWPCRVRDEQQMQETTRQSIRTARSGRLHMAGNRHQTGVQQRRELFERCQTICSKKQPAIPTSAICLILKMPWLEGRHQPWHQKTSPALPGDVQHG